MTRLPRTSPEGWNSQVAIGYVDSADHGYPGARALSACGNRNAPTEDTTSTLSRVQGVRSSVLGFASADRLRFRASLRVSRFPSFRLLSVSHKANLAIPAADAGTDREVISEVRRLAADRGSRLVFLWRWWHPGRQVQLGLDDLGSKRLGVDLICQAGGLWRSCVDWC